MILADDPGWTGRESDRHERLRCRTTGGRARGPRRSQLQRKDWFEYRSRARDRLLHDRQQSCRLGQGGGIAEVEGRAPLDLQTPRPGWGEQDARQWWDATVEATRQVTRRVDSRANRIDLHHPPARDVRPARRGGKPVLRNGILWLDSERSRPQLAALDQQFGNDILHGLTGRPPSMTQSLPKLVWLAEHEPEVIRDAARIVDVHAFLVHRLSGKWTTSLASADPMGIVDLRRGTWATEPDPGYRSPSRAIRRGSVSGYGDRCCHLRCRETDWSLRLAHRPLSPARVTDRRRVLAQDAQDQAARSSISARRSLAARFQTAM